MTGRPVDPRIILTARHNPFEIIILLMSLLSGVLNVLGFATSPALAVVTAAIPFYGWVWGFGLILGSGTALASLLYTIPMSLILERIGLTLLATLFTSHAIAIGLAAGTRGLGTALIVGSLAIGSALRVHAISRDIKMIGKAAAP